MIIMGYESIFGSLNNIRGVIIQEQERGLESRPIVSILEGEYDCGCGESVENLKEQARCFSNIKRTLGQVAYLLNYRRDI